MAEAGKDDLEKAIEQVLKKKGWGPIIIKCIGGIVVAGLTWTGTHVSKQFDSWKTDHDNMEKRVGHLEQDKAKWATLAEIQEQQIQMRIQLEILRQTWAYEYGRKLPNGLPGKPGEPDYVMPPDLLKNIERYKAIQEQKVAPK